LHLAHRHFSSIFRHILYKTFCPSGHDPTIEDYLSVARSLTTAAARSFPNNLKFYCQMSNFRTTQTGKTMYNKYNKTDTNSTLSRLFVAKCLKKIVIWRLSALALRLQSYFCIRRTAQAARPRKLTNN
jgi:hypothetical protein